MEPNSTTRKAPERVLVSELIDLAALSEGGTAPSKRRIRAALPRGWVLEDDGHHARRDIRLFFREGWILMVGLLTFGSVGGSFLWGAMPRGWRGLGRLGLLVAVVLAVGGIVGPIISRALQSKR
ncbi:MAG: hypothetical protein ACI8QS_002240 [Planctomycetota bacterium]|jgi:hypothetical protein